MNTIKKIISLVVIVCSLMAMALPVAFAAEDNIIFSGGTNGQVVITGGEYSSLSDKTSIADSLNEFLQKYKTWISITSGIVLILVVIEFIRGVSVYGSSAGNEQKRQKGMDILKMAGLGLVLLAAQGVLVSMAWGLISI